MNTLSFSKISLDETPYFSSVHERQRETGLKNESKIFYTDEAIIIGLKAQDMLIIKYIYKQFYEQIRFLIRSNSGTEMDAEDIFQDALVIMYQKISTENLKLTSSFKTYLHSICKHVWLQRLNKRKFNYENKQVVDLDEFQDNNTIEEQIEEYEKFKLFQQHFLRLNKDDQKVLNLFMNKISLKEIAQIMGYKSDKYAKVRKYICKEKLKNSILNDPHYQEIYRNERSIPLLNY